MSKPKPEKPTVNATPAKTRQHKSFVQTEGELTQTQLEAIAAGGMEIQ